jgi:hypothetical protein
MPTGKQEASGNAATGLLDLRFQHTALSSQERDAAENILKSSKHTKLTIMPNHCMSIEGELRGFSFSCAADDPASVLPLTKDSMSTTAIYECAQDDGISYLNLSSRIGETAQKLADIMKTLEKENLFEPLNLDCMPEMDFVSMSQHSFKDQRAWCENTPQKIGIYHCFLRATAQNMREHKIFIVVTGSCKQASEELYNLWLDARDDITASQFLACAEVDWLRKATLRHHNRLAARVAQGLNLPVRFIDDTESVNNASMLLPTTSCVTRDIARVREGVVITSDAVCLKECKSGIIFDCFATEGFWVFNGPRDTSSYRMFGTEFHVTGIDQCFPTKTARYHRLFTARDRSNVVSPYGRRVTSLGVQGSGVTNGVSSTHNGTALADGQMLEHVFYKNACSDITSFLFPHSGFQQILTDLGFNPNDGIANIMPIAVFCDDE